MTTSERQSLGDNALQKGLGALVTGSASGINLLPNFYAIKAVLPGMKRRNRGRIVNRASAHDA